MLSSRVQRSYSYLLPFIVCDRCSTLRRERRSSMFKTSLATLDRTGSGNLFTTAFARPVPQSRKVAQTSRNLTRSASLSRTTPPFKTFRAVGAHSEAKFQGMPKRLESPLISIVERPARTRSCGKDFSSRTGEFGLSSPFERAPMTCHV